MSKKIPVHLRDESQPSGRKHLFDVPYGTNLEEAASMLRAWGIMDQAGDYADTDQLYGHFRIRDDGLPYFEFVIGEG